METTVIMNDRARPAKRVAAYCRVSTDKESQAESLENQMEAFRRRMQLHPEWQLVDVYADEGLSGTSVTSRSKFREMILDCEAGRIDYILTKSISRFARNTLDCISYVRKLQGMGVQIFFEKEGIDTGDETSEMFLTILASFAQEESRSISENVKWGIRKRFEAGQEVKVPLYGFFHTEDALYRIQPDEAKIVKEVFERYVRGELPKAIMDDMAERGVKPPAGDCWKRLQIDRMLRNEKYAGDVILQKTYVESHLSHRQVKNHGDVPMYHIRDAHPAVVDRHIFEQAQKIAVLRRIRNGNSSYPYGEMLKCPCCGKTLTHGALSNFYYDGEKIRGGGWGCYGDDGCGEYLLIQTILDDALIKAFADRYGESKKTVEFCWLDDFVEEIRLGEKEVAILWKDGEASTLEMEICSEGYNPTEYACFYNEFLDQVRCGEKKNKHKHLMGLRKKRRIKKDEDATVEDVMEEETKEAEE